MNSDDNDFKNISRRDFIKKTSLGIGSFMIVPRHVLGKGFIAPSDKLNIAAVGLGGKGTSNIFPSWNNGSDNIVALCDVDDRMSKKVRDQFPKAPYYKDYRVLLEKEKNNIDAVIVSTPDHMHAVIAMSSMQLKKHVYVEKPLTHDIYEARMLTEAAKKHKVVTQMGNQGTSGEGIRLIQEWYNAGLIGEVKEVYAWTNRPIWPQGLPRLEGNYPVPSELDFNLWLGTAPKREFHPMLLPFKWRGWWDYGTGALGDMACHIIDVPFKVLSLGYPNEVEASVVQSYIDDFKAGYFPDSCPPASKIKFNFPGKNGKTDVKVTWLDGGILPDTPEELGLEESLQDNGVLLIGSKGKILCGVYGANPTLLPRKLMKEITLPPQSIARVENGVGGHHQQWVKACKEGYGKGFTSSPFDYSGPLTETVLMGNLAVRSFNLKINGKFPGRKKLLWDGKNMKITNFDDANQYVKRTYREGYSLGV